MDTYPVLPGLGYSVHERPRFFNSKQPHSSGREVTVTFAQYPVWEFELTYNVLRGAPYPQQEYETLLGFFLKQNGSLTGFKYRHPRWNETTAQSFATTDGTTQQYAPLLRSIGSGATIAMEPVGVIDDAQPFRLYRDGILIDPADATWGYTLVTTTPWAQAVHFNSVPAAGHVLTVDMSYFYFCKFADDTADFEEFMHRLYTVSSVKLQSKKGF
jgi:hypothetical protein